MAWAVCASKTAWLLGLILAAALLEACAARRSAGPEASRPSTAGVVPVSTDPTQEPGVEIGLASYYSRRLTGQKTASGERYDPGQMTAAHRTLPFGSWVEVRRADGRRVVVRINDRGPFVRGRIIDVSYRAASVLGLFKDGCARVELRVLAQLAHASGSSPRPAPADRARATSPDPATPARTR